MDVWMSRSHVTDSSTTKVPADPGVLYHYGHMTPAEEARVQYSHRTLADDGRAFYGHRGEYTPERQQSTVCQESGRRETGNSMGQQQYPSIPPVSSFPGITPTPHWYYLTTPTSGTLQKSSLLPGSQATSSGTKGETAALGGPPTAAAADTTTPTNATPYVKGSWVGPTGPRRSRRRYQLWRESRQFLDTCYYQDRRGQHGVKLPYCPPGMPQPPPPPPPLLPLLDLPDGRSSGNTSKPPPPLLPLSDTGMIQPPPPHHLYPPQVDSEPSQHHSLSPPETSASSRVKTTQQTTRSYLQPHHHLPEITATLPPHPHHHQPYCQYHRHLNLQDYTTYPHHLPLPGDGGDTRLRLRYPLPHPPPPCPHRRPEALIHLPQPVGTQETLRDQQIRAAAYLRTLYHP
ncbi:leucine-rich repeat extensin-like protein 5 [Homarus americanus]|uniref:leucine-rich repeat extensin-like protein 5 n=1 Tax=Homarus americanus TaxID=6706 RepID=UPI001C4596AD|nr:leucine-rich repeat extensin-like protein 5 [Homarus americanus]